MSTTSERKKHDETLKGEGQKNRTLTGQSNSLQLWLVGATVALVIATVVLGYYNYNLQSKLVEIQEYTFKPRVYNTEYSCLSRWHMGNEIETTFALVNVGNSEAICSVRIEGENIPEVIPVPLFTLLPFNLEKNNFKVRIKTKKYIETFGEKTLPKNVSYKISYMCKSVIDKEYMPEIKSQQCNYEFNTETDYYELIPDNIPG